MPLSITPPAITCTATEMPDYFGDKPKPGCHTIRVDGTALGQPFTLYFTGDPTPTVTQDGKQVPVQVSPGQPATARDRAIYGMRRQGFIVTDD